MQTFCVDTDPVSSLSAEAAMAMLAAGPGREVLERHFGRLDALNAMFERGPATEEDSGLDVEALDNFYARLSAPQIAVLAGVLERVCAKQLAEVRGTRYFRAPKALRLLDVVLQLPTIEEPALHRRLVTPVLEVVASLEPPARARCVRYWSRLGRARLEKRLALLHQVMTMRMLLPPPVAELSTEPSIVAAALAMDVLHGANDLVAAPAQRIPFAEFYNATLNEQLDLVEDFIRWIQRSGFSFCLTPFLLDPATKAQILKMESQFKQQQQRRLAMADAYRNVLMGNMVGFNPFLVFGVRRSHLIQDTLENIVRVDPEDLKKELKIKFADEEGVDAGGVQKEFFQLIVREIFNPDFGMFVLDRETRTYWFSPLSQEFREFELIGTILGLAIYNGVILDVHFPRVVYKKLMGRATQLADLADVSPDLHRGMQTLLTFDPAAVEAVYAREFQVEVDNYGQKQTMELKPGGATVPLTGANRAEYVELFVDYQLNRCVAKQFSAFKKGFDLVVNGPAFAIFTPEELELLICGEPVLDFEELEKAAQYESEEFGPDHQVVKWFWEVVHALSDDKKKMLLHFVTGSDRAPIGGLKNLHLVIQRSGGDGDDRLMSSHTCFNHLLLPTYSSKEILTAKLTVALDNATGFGLR